MDHSVQMKYNNWRAERGQRDVVPISIRFGSSKWHPEPQWLMKALDIDKGIESEFALVECDFLSVTDDQRDFAEIDAGDAG